MMTHGEDRAIDVKGADQGEALPPSAEERRRHWEEHIGRWQRSGLTQVEYCRLSGLKCSAFHYWKKRLERTATAVTLVQVPVGIHSGGQGCQPWQELILVLGDRYKVEVGDKFNPSTLARLVETLGWL